MLLSKTRNYSLLQVINRHVLELNLLGTINVGGIGENANAHARAGHMWEPGLKTNLVFYRYLWLQI
jgi:hypothetical protein